MTRSTLRLYSQDAHKGNQTKLIISLENAKSELFTQRRSQFYLNPKCSFTFIIIPEVLLPQSAHLFSVSAQKVHKPEFHK